MKLKGTREEFCEIAGMPFGKERRSLLLEWCSVGSEARPYLSFAYGFIVNSRWQLIVKKDSDLQYLIKKGKLKQVNSVCRKSGRNYLVLADRYDNMGNLLPSKGGAHAENQ